MKKQLLLALPFLLLSCHNGKTDKQPEADNAPKFEIPITTSLPEDKVALQHAVNGWWTDSQQNREERMAWYREAKFGCFIHWGVYSVPAGEWKGKLYKGYSEHLMRMAKIPVEEYKNTLVKQFNPTDFDADEWMKDVVEAGMKYFIITAKHHDGFAIYPSDAYPYDIRLTKFDRDPLQELRDAAKKYGIKFGFYYSHAFDWEHPCAPGNDWDWEHPGGDKKLGGTNWWESAYASFLPEAEKYVNEKSIPQIKELIEKYEPDIMWFDTPAKLPTYLNVKILEALRNVDKESKIVVNGRLVRLGSQNMGDYKNTGDRAAFFPPTEGDWESIPTTNESYGYTKVDSIRKPASHFIRLLSDAVSKGGNILMNIGPMGNGQWDERDRQLTRQIGQWLKVNGESIYGAKKSGLPLQTWGVTTLKGDTLYAHVHEWPRDGKLVIGGLRTDSQDAWLVVDKGQHLTTSRTDREDLIVNLPAQAPDTVNTVIALKLNGDVNAYAIRLISPKVTNNLYAFDAELKGKDFEFGDGKRNRNYLKNWKDTEQYFQWTFRIKETGAFNIFFDYNTAKKSDNGCVKVSIYDQAGKLNTESMLNYNGFTEKEGTQSQKLGIALLPPGTYTCKVRGVMREGDTFMQPIAIRLVP